MSSLRAVLARGVGVEPVEEHALLREPEAGADVARRQLDRRDGRGDAVAVDGHRVGVDDPLARDDVLVRRVVREPATRLRRAAGRVLQPADPEVEGVLDVGAARVAEPAALRVDVGEGAEHGGGRERDVALHGEGGELRGSVGHGTLLSGVGGEAGLNGSGAGRDGQSLVSCCSSSRRTASMPVEPAFPQRAVLRDPVGDVAESGRVDAAGPPLGVPPLHHEAGVLEHLEVLRHARQGHRERLRELADRSRRPAPAAPGSRAGWGRRGRRTWCSGGRRRAFGPVRPLLVGI